MINYSKNKDKIIFSKEIDKSINNYSLVLTFIVLGLILQIYPSIFGEISEVVTYVFVATGVLGFFSISSNYFKKYKLEGSTDILSGLALLFFLIVMKGLIVIRENWPMIVIIGLKIIYIFLFLVTIYGFFNGIIKLLYSIYLKIKKTKKKEKLLNIGFKLMVEILGVILVVLQIREILGGK